MEKLSEIRQLKYLVGGFMILSLALALLFTYLTQSDNQLSKIQKSVPKAKYFDKVSTTPLTFIGYSDENKTNKVGYISIAEARGYSGPLTMSVGVDMEGKIISTIIVEHNDTPAYIQKVLKDEFLEKFAGRNANDSLILGKDIDGISGATYSTRGIVRGIAYASHEVAKSHLGLTVQEEQQSFIFGLKEMSIIILFCLMLIGVTSKISKLRWVTQIGGLVLIGFAFNMAPSIGTIAGIFMGLFPPIQEFIFWYLLFVGIPLIIFILRKNVYCYWVCPFGAVQEIATKLSGSKLCFSNKVHKRAKIAKYFLTYLALMLAFLFNKPSIATFEPFAVLFSQNGYGVQWLILPIILLASLFIDRFWCNYFCPVGVFNEIAAKLGRKLMSLKKLRDEKFLKCGQR